MICVEIDFKVKCLIEDGVHIRCSYSEMQILSFTLLHEMLKTQHMNSQCFSEIVLDTA